MHLEKLEGLQIMTKENEPIIDQPIKKKDINSQLRLHDSMEFYKQKGITNSPPKVCEQQTLLVGDEEDEIALLGEEMPIVRQLFVDSLGDEEEERCIEIEEAKEEFKNEQFRDFDSNTSSDDDDDDIIFADSDTEEEGEPKIEKISISTPFWFGNEEKEQLRFINESYAAALKLEDEKRRLVRQPEPFVGKIERTQVDNGNVFTTFDVVEVYRRSLLPPGSVMPFLRKEVFLTEWSTEEGVPLHFSSLHTEGMKTMWKKKIIKDTKSSILFCMPEYGTSEYEFSVSEQNLEVTHSPSSLQTIEQRGWYDKYIPEDLRHPAGQEGDDLGA